MESKAGFKRDFLILKQEDGGYGYKQEPSGFVKIEVKFGKGKLYANVQNLLEQQNGAVYRLYLLRCDENQVCSVCAGIIPIKESKGYLEWEFNPEDVASTRNSIESFKILAVISEPIERKNDNITCPLSAYRDKKIAWKNRVASLLMPHKREEDEKTVEEFREIYKEPESYIEEEKTDMRLPEENLSYEDKDSIRELDPQVNEYEKFSRWDAEYNLVEEKETLEENKEEEKREEENIEEEKREGCSYMNGFNCPQIGDFPGVNPCINCLSHNFMNDSKMNNSKNVLNNNVSNVSNSGFGGKNEVSTEQLKKVFDKCFEPNDPFGSKRRDYSWWKVGSPVNLNNVLYQCNIKTPLLFNPLVMMSHYKYRYLIVGVYSDRMRGREYLVCGIPGVHGIDERPFGDMCKWIQLEGTKPKYGVFGYWLVYIDPKTGNFQRVN